MLSQRQTSSANAALTVAADMNLKQFAKPIVLRTAHLVGIRQSEGALAKASARYWSGAGDTRFRGNSHWRGDDGIATDVWPAIGERHVQLYRQFAAFAGVDPTPKRVVEWGCGGGANAVAF